MRFPEGLFIDVEKRWGVKICCTPQGKFCAG